MQRLKARSKGTLRLRQAECTMQRSLGHRFGTAGGTIGSRSSGPASSRLHHDGGIRRPCSDLEMRAGEFVPASGVLTLAPPSVMFPRFGGCVVGPRTLCDVCQARSGPWQQGPFLYLPQKGQIFDSASICTSSCSVYLRTREHHCESSSINLHTLLKPSMTVEWSRLQ